MTFEEAFVIELSTITSHVYPLNAPEGTKDDYITYESGSGSNYKALDGYNSLINLSFSVDILCTKYSELKKLSKLVVNKLKTFEQRTIGNNGPFIQELTFEDDSPELYESQVSKYSKKIYMTISFKEV